MSGGVTFPPPRRACFRRPYFFAVLSLWGPAPGKTPLPTGAQSTPSPSRRRGRRRSVKRAAPTGAQSTPPPSRRLERRRFETPFPIGDPKGRCSFGGASFLAPSFEQWVYSKLGGSTSRPEGRHSWRPLSSNGCTRSSAARRPGRRGVILGALFRASSVFEARRFDVPAGGASFLAPSFEQWVYLKLGGSPSWPFALEGRPVRSRALSPCGEDELREGETMRPPGFFESEVVRRRQG